MTLRKKIRYLIISRSVNYPFNDKKCRSKTYLKTISINNVSTPNNDGFNDHFQLRYPLFKLDNYQINIFNRLGELVQQGKVDEKFTWDRTNSRGTTLPTGAYWYVIFSKDVEKRYTGFILLKNH